MLSISRRRPHLDLLQQVNDPGRPIIPENPVQPFDVQVGEGGLVEQAGTHGAVLGQIADGLVDEPDLGG